MSPARLAKLETAMRVVLAFSMKRSTAMTWTA